ncbi:sulfotransferase [Flammeovirga pacifica]|uniref:Sulfotransferase domain-containing protein n=1 Tax=Flammeovirga pacifica TaxID=915059 RepID=A0A1S1YX47_FLAPC|nr:sulfotransferase [Flammeovirga pacifica]OHX65558.1 hypothetical protein NH26_03945 [Flammeovirga pacifica]
MIYLRKLKFLLKNSIDILDYYLFRINKQYENYETVILIASMGRSGSTLLSEIINFNNEYKELFEPFISTKVNEVSNFTYPTSLKKTSKSQIHFLQAKRVISGHIDNRWVNQLKRRKNINKLLIKDIRVNFFLGWLKTNFSSIKVILLIRDPLKTIKSWQNAGFDNGDIEYQFLRKKYYSMLSVEQQKIFNEADSSFKKLIILWCLTYFIPISEMTKSEYLLVKYEDILRDNLDALRLYLDDVSLKYTIKPSRTSSLSYKLKKYNNHLSAEDLIYLKKAIKLFGLDSLYNYSK